MRWKQPVEGEERTRKIFLLLPALDSRRGLWRWLEWAIVKEKYAVDDWPDGINMWQRVEFVD